MSGVWQGQSQGVVAAETLIGLFFLDLMDPEWRGIFPLFI
jgi:hypothetical protein